MRIRNLKLIGAIFISAHSIVVTVSSKINGDNYCFNTFRVNNRKYSEVNMMRGRFLTQEIISDFKGYLILEERSTATVEKYIRDVNAFSAFVNGAEITKEVVIEYKKHLQENYAVWSINSMLASINGLFVFLCWHELKVKSIKLQQKIYCPEEKELTKAEYTRLCRAAEKRHNERLNLILQTICGTESE